MGIKHVSHNNYAQENIMNVSQAVESRVSCRGFKKEPVEQEVLEAIFLKAQQDTRLSTA